MSVFPASFSTNLSAEYSPKAKLYKAVRKVGLGLVMGVAGLGLEGIGNDMVNGLNVVFTNLVKSQVDDK